MKVSIKFKNKISHSEINQVKRANVESEGTYFVVYCATERHFFPTRNIESVSVEGIPEQNRQ